MEKQFAIVELPKNGEMLGDTWMSDPAFYNDYEEAFDAFNDRIAMEDKQVFKMPKGTPPLRVALSDRDIELWVITRTKDLAK